MSEVLETAPPAFFKHNHEQERGMRQVTRASAVYYFARRAGFRTQLLYMNYWHEKRGLTNVDRHLTLRSMDGEVIYRSTERVAGLGGHTVEINDILDTIKDAPDQGSFEVEFTSPTNMAIAYPAAIVRYIGPDWHTLAHASQRYYSETSGDDLDMVGRIQMAEEGNITILEDDGAEPFVIIHNGPVSIAPTPIELSVFSSDGRSHSTTIAPMAWAPYQTRLVRLGDHIDHRGFLAGERGTFSLKFPIGGVFPRLIGGSERQGAWSIDHTNFAATKGPAASDVIPIDGRETFKDLVFNLPNNAAEGWDCFADIYPTYPSEGYSIEVRNLDKNGQSSEVAVVPVSPGGAASFPRIHVDNAEVSGGANVELLFRHPHEVPRRFHTGIHYRIGDGLPGFLTDGPLPHSTPAIRTRWFPVFEPTGTRNFLLIANRTIGEEAPVDVRYGLKLFNGYGDEPKLASFTLAKNESRCLPLDELFPEAAAFLKERAGWVYMSADQPQRSVLHYASVRGTNSIAVCHAF